MKKILLLPNSAKDADYSKTRRVVLKLLALGAELVAEEKHRDSNLPGVRFTSDSSDLLSSNAAIVLGGDGSMLEAAMTVLGHDIPILGINLGRLGYMSGMELEEIDLLKRLCSDDYTVENRMMLEARIKEKNGNEISILPALNEIVLQRNTLSGMADLRLTCMGELVGEYRADGVIIATPTGSTAYSMSAGGSVLDPALDAIEITPICPHSLNTRPIVFSADKVISVTNECLNEWILTCDGRDSMKLSDGCEVTVFKSRFTTGLINLKKNGFFDVLRRKTSEMK